MPLIAYNEDELRNLGKILARIDSMYSHECIWEIVPFADTNETYMRLSP